MIPAPFSDRLLVIIGTGTTAIALWGDTEGVDGAPEGMGWDGRAGNQPRGTLISQNLIHELGQHFVVFSGVVFSGVSIGKCRICP